MGPWGDDDDRGALNLLTPERVARAAALVRDGVTVPCGRPLATAPAVDNPSPALHHMIHAGDMAAGSKGLQWSGDFVGVAFHGNSVSHIDALCHVFVDGQMYNGAPASDVTSVGARRSSIEVADAGIVGRGVLLDIPRAPRRRLARTRRRHHARRARRHRRGRRAGRHRPRPHRP